jgi:anthranilate synthase component 1
MSSSSYFASFEKNFTSGESQLVWRWIPADMDTPVSAFLKLSNDAPYSLLLESVEGGKTLGRYSAIGLKPDLIWKYDENGVHLNDEKQNTAPVASLREQLKASKIDCVEDSLPPMAPSGLFGFMGYDCIRLIEDIPDNNPNDLDLPESILMRPTVMVIFDNVKSMMCLVTPVRHHAQNSDLNAAQHYAEAEARLDGVFNDLMSPIDPSKLHSQTKLDKATPPESNMTQDDFHNMVHRAKEDILAGEIFQAVLSQRFKMPFDLPAFDLYRSLRRLNPSPFLFYINFDGFALVGSSPEVLVRVRDRTMTVRPIAGTRKRGKDAAEDKALMEELLADPKECAEHLMLVDLGRNDIGKVAIDGSVTVTDSFFIEKYSHVMHIVSNVEGKLRENIDSLDALFAGFPHGTVSGAPKIRAMEIIDDLEPTRRGTYAGCVGYMDGNGDLDTCIALRTALVKDGHVYVQAGGGVVADSDPEFEYQESCNKARAVLQAAEEAIKLAQRDKN